MTFDFLQINSFFKQLSDFRESTNIADFFFLPHIVHANRLLPQEVSEIHEQRTFEISLVLTGDMIYTIKNKDVPVQAGDLIIIPPDIEHYWTVLEKGADVFGFMVNISKHGDGSRRDLSLLNGSIKKHNYHIAEFSSFEAVIRQIIKEIAEQETAVNNKVFHLTRIAFIELIRKLLPDIRKPNTPSRNFPPTRGESKKDIIGIVYYYIQDNIDHSISLGEIANHVGLSKGYLNLLFKQETNITIKQAIINRRLQCACRYLKQTDRQIKDIATLLGYNDVNYFHLQFKSKYGMTPSIYRHRHI